MSVPPEPTPATGPPVTPASGGSVAPAGTAPGGSAPAPAAAPAGTGAPAGDSGRETVVVESCTTTWAFDTARHRFARVPRGLALNVTSAEWRSFASMTIDPEAGTLVVALDEAGTKLLRAEVHTRGGPCPACGAVVRR